MTTKIAFELDTDVKDSLHERLGSAVPREIFLCLSGLLYLQPSDTSNHTFRAIRMKGPSVFVPLGKATALAATADWSEIRVAP